MRISVDEGGKPWVLSYNGDVYRYATNSPFTGVWNFLGTNPGGQTPTESDITIGKGNYAYVTHKVGGVVDVWREQPSGPGNPVAPQLAGWVRMVGTYPGGGTALAVTPTAELWVVSDSYSNLYRTRKRML